MCSPPQNHLFTDPVAEAVFLEPQVPARFPMLFPY